MRRQGDQPQEVAAACLDALTALPEEATFARGVIMLWLADAYDRMGEGDAAEEALAQATQSGLAADGKLIALVIAGVQVRNAWVRGDLHTVARVCRETLTSVVRPAEKAGERLPYACHFYAGLGRTLLSWNDFEQAEPLLWQAVDLAHLAMQTGVLVDCCRDLAALHMVQGDYQEAHAWMDKALEACHGEPAFLHALRARIWLTQAETEPRWLDLAIQWADGRVLEDPGDYSWELQSLVRVRIAQYRACREPDLVPILAVLDEHLEVTDLDSSGWRVQVLAIRALLLQALGRTREALQALKGSLEVAEATGRVTVFLEHGLPMYKLLKEAARRNVVVDHTRRIMAAFEMRGRTGTPDHQRLPLQAASREALLIESLSEREQEVLRLLATTLSGPEIADRLAISISTFRSHTKSIYGKLDVHSRLDAVARAQALHLL
jgi:LuxR family maltose regulon positive regulatory protein